MARAKSEREMALYYERKAKGLCVDCGNVAERKKTLCLYHAQRKAERKALLRADSQIAREMRRTYKPKPQPKKPYVPVYGGLLEAPSPPAERPVYVFNRRDRATQLDHLREAG